MTVCIAAMAQDGKEVYGVADKMISLSGPMPYQYEIDDVTKIYKMNANWFLMASGNTLFAHEVAQLAVGKVNAIKDDTLEAIIDAVVDAYHEYRLKLITDSVFKPRKMTQEEYLEKQQSLHPDVVKAIENALTETNLGIDLIVAGKTQGQCHVYIVSHPGIAISYDAVGYACVGIGAPHAQLSLVDSKYHQNKGVAEVKKLVMQAKKKSENAPGVGKQTDEISI